jgi:hypothetical protein
MNHTDTEGSGVSPRTLESELQQFAGRLHRFNDAVDRFRTTFQNLANELQLLSEEGRRLVKTSDGLADLLQQPLGTTGSVSAREVTLHQPGSPREGVDYRNATPSGEQPGSEPSTASDPFASEMTGRMRQRDVFTRQIAQAQLDRTGLLPFPDSSSELRQPIRRAMDPFAGPSSAHAPVVPVVPPNAASAGSLVPTPRLPSPSEPAFAPPNQIGGQSPPAQARGDGYAKPDAGPAQVAQDLGSLWTRLFEEAARQRRAINQEEARVAVAAKFGPCTFEDQEQYAIVSFSGKADCYVLPLHAKVSEGSVYMMGFFQLDPALAKGQSPIFHTAAVVQRANLMFPPTPGTLTLGRISIPGGH